MLENTAVLSAGKPQETFPARQKACASNLPECSAATISVNAPSNKTPKCWGCEQHIESGKAIRFAEGVWHIE
ncbi:hypothetical protein EV182_005574, partial [Spiromyces aspiralis]